MAKYVGETSLSQLVTKTKNLISLKQDVITGGASTIASNNLTASRALVSNANGKVAVSDITTTELGYLDGVTSNLQTQLDGKQTSLGVGLAGKVLTSNGSTINWDYLCEQNEYSLTFNSANGYISQISGGTTYKNNSNRPLLVILYYDTDINNSLNTYSGFSLSVGSTASRALMGFDNANNQFAFRAIRSANANVNSNISIQCIVPPMYYFVFAAWGGATTTNNGGNLQARFLKL